MKGITRLVVCNASPDSAGEARDILRGAFGQLAGIGQPRLVLQTPGGFVGGPLEGFRGQAGWYACPDMVPVLRSASKALRGALPRALVRDASKLVHYITVGVDLYAPDDTTHAELVAVVDTQAYSVQWTGKIFPVAAEERTLVRVCDPMTHSMLLADRLVLVLGCNDLNVWNPRGIAEQAKGSPRAIVREQMFEMVARLRPEIVLHHPHYVDTPDTWRAAWSNLRSTVPSVRSWSGAVRYMRAESLYGPSQRPVPPRAGLRAVLAGTASDDVVDIRIGCVGAPE